MVNILVMNDQHLVLKRINIACIFEYSKKCENMKRLTFSLSMVLLATVQLFSQLTPWQAVELMGRGINMGNTLDAPTEGAWAPAAEEYYFDAYKDAGFTTVRIPVTWNAHFADTSPYTIDSIFLDRVDTIVSWALERGLYVILNAHHDDWLKNDYEAQKERFDSLWSQISVRFKDKPESLFFEMLNEPHSAITSAQVDELNARVLGIIRKTNPTRIVIFSGSGYSNSADLIAAAIPDPDDEYLMGYYHSYDPWSFAGEAKGTWGSISDRNNMNNQMNSVKSWSDSKNIPVLIGEFGAIRTCDYNSRMKYYAVYTELALAHGFAFTVWDDGGNFQILQRGNGTWNELKDILIYTTAESPTNLVAKNNNGDSISLSWTNRSSDYDSIVIEKGTTALGLVRIASLAGDVIKFIDEDVEYTKSYYYRIRAWISDTTELPSYPVRVKAEHASGLLESTTDRAFLYPNPATNWVYVGLPAGETAKSVIVYDLNGRKVGEYELSGGSFPVDYLQVGYYFAKIKTDKSEYSVRFGKQ